MYGLGSGVMRATKTGPAIQDTHAHTGTHTDQPHHHIFPEASVAWAPISVWDIGIMPSTVAATS